MRRNDALLLLGCKLLSALEIHGSLTEAAMECNIDISVASKTISKLEVIFGLKLINRHTRPKTLTPQAMLLLPTIRRLLSAERALHSEILNHRFTENNIRLSLSTGTINAYKMQGLRDYESKHPGVHLEVVADDTHVSVLEGHVDIAVVSYPYEHPDLVTINLGVCATLPLASPAYLAEHGTPHEPEELVGHTILVVPRKFISLCDKLYRYQEIFSFDAMQRYQIGKKEDCENQCKTLARPNIIPNAYHPAMISCLQGQGIAVDLALGLVREHLERHELVPVLNGWHRAPWKKCLLVRQEALQKSQIGEFVQWFCHYEPESSHQEWTYWYKHFGIPIESVQESVTSQESVARVL